MKNLAIFIIINLLAISLQGQGINPELTKTIGLKEYVARVAGGNLGYLAEQYNFEIADALLTAAKIYSDPEFSIAFADNQDRKMQMGKGLDASLGYNLNLGNIRGARVEVADSEKELARLAIKDYFQNLRAQAAIVYFNALKEESLVEVQEDTYLRMKELARVDSIRFLAGIIMEVDARQSSIESRIQKNEVIRADASFNVALIRLSRLNGKVISDTTLLPQGPMEFYPRAFSLGKLIEDALRNRSDLQYAIANRTLSERMINLVRAGRSMELNVETGMSYSTVALNEMAPAPAHYSYNMGLSIPLKFSNINRAEVDAARLTLKQTEIECLDAEQSIIAEVTESYLQYQAQKKQIEEFHAGLLTEAETILNSKLYSYKRGETSLLEVLNAQRTFNEVRQRFYETQYGYIEALIALEKAAGIWDIE
jgi:outer membrane protein, heavy metal efflux system